MMNDSGEIQNLIGGYRMKDASLGFHTIIDFIDFKKNGV
jgi:hypothetical protein